MSEIFIFGGKTSLGFCDKEEDLELNTRGEHHCLVDQSRVSVQDFSHIGNIPTQIHYKSFRVGLLNIGALWYFDETHSNG